jgi:ketosteroid isomerase-like protein
MAITSESVRELFKGLENGDGGAFFERVADDVDWIVMGTHPLAGHYRSKKDFREGTFAMRFDNRYCWVVYFQKGLIVRVRAYLDSAMVARLFEENPIA